MKKIILLAFLVFVPQITNANIYISEIMYDLEGTDSDREWVEIHNDTSQSIDLSSYYFYENSVAHRISGDQNVAAGEFAVIVDSVEKFMEDWPNYSGSIFDSSFALNNSGEEISLLDPQKQTVDNLIYNPELGAEGTGNTLQSYEGVWIPGLPTPGAENVTEPESEIDEDEGGDNSNSNSEGVSAHSSQNELSDYKPKLQVKTGIGRDRFVSTNSLIEFEIYKSDNEKGKHFWNFGDGKSDKGGKVKHSYKYAGEYNVILNSIFENHKNTSRIKVFVEDPKIEIIEHDNGVELKNVGNKELNVGEFILEIDSEKTKILKDTIISKGHSVFFESQNKPQKILLKYPNKKLYYSNSQKRAEEFCKKASDYGLNCSVHKMKEIFDRM